MRNTLGFAFGLAALLAGCNADHSDTDAATSQSPRLMSAPVAMMAPPLSESADEATAEVSPKSAADAPAIPTAIPASRRLIYHADLRLKVVNLPRAAASLDSLVQRNGGYLSAATEVRAEGEWRRAMTIRVVPARFQPLLAALNGVGTVEEKKLTTDDVTAQHADVAARLRTKRAVEQRYLALLSRAKKVSEMLEIEEKVGEVREEIESTESRLKTLNDEVAYSTISMTCYQVLPVATPDAPVVSLGSRLVGAVYGGWSLLTGLLIGMVSIWPLLILGFVAWWAVLRWRRVNFALKDKD